MSDKHEPPILVVDDDAANRYVKVHILERGGYRVSEAADGETALAVIAREHPALVLLDVKLPGRSGIEVGREVKERWPGTLVLQTSAAFTAASDRATALAGGADSFLVEPIEPRELCATVASLLRLSHAEQDLRRLNDELMQRVAVRTRELVETNRRLVAEGEVRVKLEETLRHAEKLDALGQLMGGVAHDFNNLLTVVIGNLELTEQECARLPPQAATRLPKLVTAAYHAAQDCERLTRQLLAFARRDVARLEILDPNRIIGGFQGLLARALGERIELELRLTPHCGACRLDGGQCEATLLNLAVNARDAMPLGGKVWLSTENVDIDTPDALVALRPLTTEARLGRYVCIGFADSGIGMTDQVLRHAFEPFFTTKDVGKGSGLGLSQVYGFVRRSGGFISVETLVDRGTTFKLFLPRQDAINSIEEDSARIVEAARGDEVILVVEDNELVLEFAAASITDLGYRVLLAPDARTALDIIGGCEPIDLLFTDLVLPNRMSGAELAREARRLRPELKVLMTSGFSAHPRSTRQSDQEFPIIPKPYRRDELARRIRAALSGVAV